VPHDISDLIACTRRDEWRDALATLIDRHATKACPGVVIDVADIDRTPGDYAASTLWGAAFEDLIATDARDRPNIADDYLRLTSPIEWSGQTLVGHQYRGGEIRQGIGRNLAGHMSRSTVFNGSILNYYPSLRCG
jgi:hypothetical protein